MCHGVALYMGTVNFSTFRAHTCERCNGRGGVEEEKKDMEERKFHVNANGIECYHTQRT